MRCSGRDVPFEVVTSVLYIVDSSPTDRVSFADFVATIRVALCVMPMLGAQSMHCTFYTLLLAQS